nr:uncharacterized protein LOC111425540 [Onthophagus taurus]
MSSSGENPNRKRMRGDENESDNEVEIIYTLKNPDDEKINKFLQEWIRRREMSNVEVVEKNSENLSNTSSENSSNVESETNLKQKPNKKYQFMLIARNNGTTYEVYEINNTEATNVEYVSVDKDNNTLNFGMKGEIDKNATMKPTTSTEENVSPQNHPLSDNHTSTDNDVIASSSKKFKSI